MTDFKDGYAARLSTAEALAARVEDGCLLGMDTPA